MRLNKNGFNLDLKTLGDGELRTVFQTVGVAQRKARSATSVKALSKMKISCLPNKAAKTTEQASM